jgi:hypothetical protein
MYISLRELRKLMFRCAARDIKTCGRITLETQAMAATVRLRKQRLAELELARFDSESNRNNGMLKFENY